MLRRSALLVSAVIALAACSDPAPVFVINNDASDTTTGGADGSGGGDVTDPDAGDDATADVDEDTVEPDVAVDVVDPDVTEDVTPDVAPDVVEDTTPDVAPDVTEDTTPDVAPDVVEDTTPDVAPDVVADVTPDVAPDVVEDTTPDVATDTTPDVVPDVVEDTTPDVTPVEICDNGVDDDGDSFADCQDTDCSTRAGCRMLMDEGVLAPCGNEAGQGGTDSWLIGAAAEPAYVRFELVDDDSSVDLSFVQWLPAGDPEAVASTELNIVEYPCAAGSPELCEFIQLDAVLSEIDLAAGYGTCGDATSVGYRVITRGASAPVANRDDVLSPLGAPLCDDGEDNDGDGDVDCDDPDCSEECGGDALVDTGSFDVCPGQADIWSVTFGPGGGTISFDTVSAATTFDPVAVTFTAVDGTFTTTTVGDDDFPCTFPPTLYSCPSAAFDEGTYEVFMFAGAADSQCSSATLAEYEVTAEGATSLVQTRDNLAFPALEVCDDGIDNNSNGFYDCGDAACADTPACTEPGPRSVQGALEPCLALDTYIVTVGPGVSNLRVDTISATSAFDPAITRFEVIGDYSADVSLGDDEFECTFPPPSFSCPETSLSEGVYEIAVLDAGRDAVNCVDTDFAEYEISGDNLISIVLELDDVLPEDLPGN